MAEPPESKTVTGVLALDEAEAVVRFIEGFAGFTRPPGMPALAVLQAFAQADSVGLVDVTSIREGVRRVFGYVHEEFDKARPGGVELIRVPSRSRQQH